MLLDEHVDEVDDVQQHNATESKSSVVIEHLKKAASLNDDSGESDAENAMVKQRNKFIDPSLRSYKRRFMVLFSFTLTYFLWTMTESRAVVLAPAFAQYHNIPNNAISSDGEIGVDFLSVFGNIIIIFSYFGAAWVTDRKGIFVALCVGNFGLALGGWIWYFSGTSFAGVIVSKAISAILGPLVSGSLLAVSNRWFPEGERAKATATGAFGGLMGAGAAILVGPAFETSGPVIDLELKSCRMDQIDASEMNRTIEAFRNAKQNETLASCTVANFKSTIENFCCYSPTDIETLNLVYAIALTLAALLCVAVVRDKPELPPAYGGMPKENKEPLFEIAKRLAVNPRFMLLNLSDFIIGGMPTVAFVSIARILPAEVQELDFIVAAAGLALAIPFCIGFSTILDKYRAFFQFTFGAYVTGAIIWSIAAIGYELNSGGLGCESTECQETGAYIVLVCIGLAFIDVITWAVAEYECKLEYTFETEVSVEGAVVSIDRIVENLNGLVFVTLFAPERFARGSRDVVLYGTIVMWVGILPALLIKDKTKYRRVEFERDEFVRRSTGSMGPPTAQGATV